MNDFQQNLEKYAELVLRKGVNLQKDQPLMVNAPVDGAYFVRVVAKKAYELGAKEVHINWTDDDLVYMRYKNVDQKVLEDFPQWRVDMLTGYAKEGAAVLSIYATDPDLLKGIDSAKIAAANKAQGTALKEYRDYTMNDKIPWTVLSIPVATWAKKIFPDLTAEEAQEKLWDQIFKIVRVDKEDPVQAWTEHNQTLAKVEKFLNEKKFKKLVYKAPGTDLEIELPEGHLWKGGSAKTEKGIEFNPNMPTEEVFTAPHKYGVNGKVSSTLPLNYGGNVIDKFTLTFKDGEVVDYAAEEGLDTLKHLLETDEGSRRLGEVALVPHQSPISQSGLIFYNTLYDENASCHLALGKAYPTNVEGGSAMSDEELDKNGINDSLSHVDFMMGSAELDIDGVTADGQVQPIFRKGNWAIDF
ncbi:aminopeptidase [Bacillaceae bacterium S4-13-56]